MPELPEVVLVAVRAGDEVVQDEREAEREQEEAPVAERAQELVARVRRAHAAPPAPRRVVVRQLHERLLEAGARDLEVAASGLAASSARSAASLSRADQHDRLAADARRRPRRAARRAREPSAPGQRGADRARPDPRLDLGRRAVGDDRAVRPSARRGRRTRRPPRGSASRTRRSCRARRRRASSPRTRAGPRRPSRPSARRARAGRGWRRSRREAHALGLAARELLRAPAGDVGRYPHSSSTSSTSSGCAVERRRSSRRARGRERSRSSEPVCSIAPTPPVVDRARPGPPEHRDRARVGPGQAEQHLDRGRLARAVRPEQRDRLARRDLEVDAGDRVHRALRGAERLRARPWRRTPPGRGSGAGATAARTDSLCRVVVGGRGGPR